MQSIRCPRGNPGMPESGRLFTDHQVMRLCALFAALLCFGVYHVLYGPVTVDRDDPNDPTELHQSKLRC